MKILLLTTENTLVCFGLRQVAASLKNAGFTVQSLFMPKEFNRNETQAEIQTVCEFALNFRPDAIGCSLMSSHLLRSRAVCRGLRTALPGIPIVWGGIHPTLKPEECLRDADYVVQGEGEITACELFRALEQKLEPREVLGVWYRHHETIVHTECRPRITELDALPLPDYDLDSQWILHQGSIVRASEPVMKRYVPGLMDTQYVMSSRGCPHSCSYCCNSALRKVGSGPYLRRRSPEHFISEMVQALTRFSTIKGFVFMDDSFLYGDPEWFAEFARLYAEKVNLPFFCWANPVAVKEEVINLLVQIGLVGVHVGLESGSERIAREVYNRPVSSEVFLNAMAILAKYKDKVVDRRVDIITDNPYETEQDTIASINLLTQLEKPFFLGIVSLLFYPMTALTDRACADGILEDGGVHIYHREFFHYRPTYLNRVMRTIPITPKWLIDLFIRNRTTKLRRGLFYAYYFGYFIAIRRQLKNLRRKLTLLIFKHFEHKLSPRRIVVTRVGLIDF